MDRVLLFLDILEEGRDRSMVQRNPRTAATASARPPVSCTGVAVADAWNRLVKLTEPEASAPGATLQENQYGADGAVGILDLCATGSSATFHLIANGRVVVSKYSSAIRIVVSVVVDGVDG